MSSPGQDGLSSGPEVSTAPPAPAGTTPDVAPGTRWWSSIPRHLGRARTSTVVLSVLFLSLFTLWLYVRPESPQRAPAVPDEPAVVDNPVLPVPTAPVDPEPTTPPPPPTAPTTDATEGTDPPATTTRAPGPTSTPAQTTAPDTAPPQPDEEPAPATATPPAGG